jgi:ParB-like chromosome segregation protein Spo0J
MRDALPPTVVFDVGERLLLVDGYHRVAAARRRSLETIEAEVRRAVSRDALQYAAMWGATQRGISPMTSPPISSNVARDAGPQSAGF